MRKLLLATAAGGALLAGAAVPASAADLAVAPAPAPVVAPVVPVFTWSGGYIGGNIGGIWGKNDFNPVLATLTAGPIGAPPCGLAPGGACGFAARTNRDSAVIGGFQTGYRWQFGQWVIGFEQDYQATSVRTGFVLGADAPIVPGGPFLAGDAFRAKLNWLSNTKAQLGVAFDRFLVYATGGLATGSMDVTGLYGPRPTGEAGIFAPGSVFTEKSKFHAGYTVGGGVDYAITNNISIGAEYRYTDLGHETYNLGAFANVPVDATYTSTARVDSRSHEVVGRLNIKTEPLLAMFGIH